MTDAIFVHNQTFATGETISLRTPSCTSAKDSCLTAPAVREQQTPVITVRGAKRTRYVFVKNALRRFKRWITVTAKEFRRAIVRAFDFRHFTVTALFNRTTFARQGGLRL